VKDVLRATGASFSLQQWVARTCPDRNRADLIGIVYGVAAMAEPKTAPELATGCAIIARSTAPTMVSCERPSTNPVTMPAKTARAFLDRYPKAAYMSEVEHWRELPNGRVEFTMRRLLTAD